MTIIIIFNNNIITINYYLHFYTLIVLVFVVVVSSLGLPEYLLLYLSFLNKEVDHLFLLHIFLLNLPITIK